MASLVSRTKNKVRRAKNLTKNMTTMWFKLRYHYGWHYQHSPIDDHAILFESFHGKTMSDSPLYMLREFLKSPRSKGFKVYYSTLQANLKAHRKLAEALGLDVEFVTIESWKYAKLLATAKYLVNNSSFPAYFTRRPEQHYMQTFHGTPLKTLGKQMRAGIESMYNVQHNFLQASILTFPNEFSRDAMMRDYNLFDLYTGDVALVGYPRNQIFFDTDKAREIRADYHLEDFETFAYMPTWRGSSNYSVNIEGYRTELMGYLGKLDAAMRDDQLMFVNFHSMVASKIKLDSFEHILPFPADADNYEFLNAMDVLITDYSSVFFDYSLTRKPVLMFIYDKDEYLSERGMYLDIEELPFPKARTIDELVDMVRTGSFKNSSYAGSDYERRFLSNDSARNSALALDLLFNGAAQGVAVESFARNAQRAWRTVEPRIQKSVADVRAACEAADGEHDIVVFRKNDFNPTKSEMLHDEFRDDFNFVFITKALNLTPAEEIMRRFAPSVKAAVDRRERQRMLPGLDVPTTPETEVYSGAIGSNYILVRNELLTVKTKVRVENNRLKLQMDLASIDDKLEPRAIVAAKGRTILWRRELEGDEAESGRITVTLRSLFKNVQLVAGDKVELFLEAMNANGKPTLVAMGVSGKYKYRDGDFTSALIGLVTYRPTKEADDTATVFGERIYQMREHIRQSDDVAVFAPFKNPLGGLSLLAGFRNRYLTNVKNAALESVEHLHRSEGDRVRVKANMYDGAFIVEDVVLKLRNEVDPTEIGLPYSVVHAEEGKLEFEIEFDPTDCPLREVYWDCYIVVRLFGAKGYIPILMNSLQQARFVLGNQQWILPDGKLLFTHIAKRGALAFVYRDYYPKLDTMALRAKEVAAFGVFAMLHPYWKRKRVWLVYEKFCKLAQDNGYYFFEYCMSLPEEQRKHIFYVIDKSQPDYANVAPYDAQVIDFMSFKHILYIMVSKMYVASDSRSHLYVWRPKPSIIRARMRSHKILFLQHGVTALKQDANLFGKKGSSPMTYYLTTSKNEQDVIVGNFGYSARQAPVLGFSRWDVLEDRSSAEAPVILLMPTWRPWLEEVSDELFVESDYFKSYSSFIQSPALARMLEKHNARLRFFIHPKLSERLKNFDTISDRVELVPQGSEQLNFVMMESNMIVTDYSSVCWDMLYMDKPVVFYQFDQDLYNRATGSYIDLNTELPGDVCLTEDDAIAAIDACAARGFALTDEHTARAEGWFAHKDTDNRQRTFNFLLDRGF